MASFGPRKRASGDDTVDHDDIISHLPMEVKYEILTKLPIKDAVRTSILSTKWRYTWASVPKLVVKDGDLVSTVYRDARLASFHFVKNVDILLLNHHGPILKFNLSTKYHCPEAFDRWILNLSRNGITELTFVLNLASISLYGIPSNFFLCDKLQYVNLSRCLVKLPCGFEGFKFLRNLELEECTISAADLEWLVSSSPNLLEAVFKNVQVGDELRIFSKRLKCLTVWGDFPDIRIDAPNLTALVIGCFNYTTSPTRVNRNNFYRFLGGLSDIRNFGFFDCSIALHVDRSPVMLLNLCFQNLRFIVLDIDLADQKESSFALSLLQNATNFRHLFLIVKRSGNTLFSSLWEKDNVFRSLQTVHISRFKASEPGLAFVKFILSSSPGLRKCTLKEDPLGSREGNPEIFKRLLKFPRASARAEVIFE